LDVQQEVLLLVELWSVDDLSRGRL